ncbi:hypothetical protein C8N25_11022 [Algoriphagus antarcticus]|uniref:Uncharacterized protein n=1 Tax=Algoriphagus antarcticus TaxID=238540 RepID=A0A3E0DUE1_9BACT|nr:hypothetical protein C8N25_11022 [Algoriphagus antarcticus]
MNGGINDKTLTSINFLILGYFILLWLVNYFQINFAIIGVFVELLTIPFLLAQLVFLVIGVKFILNNEKRLLTIVSLLALALCTFITIGSFFWH